MLLASRVLLGSAFLVLAACGAREAAEAGAGSTRITAENETDEQSSAVLQDDDIDADACAPVCDDPLNEPERAYLELDCYCVDGVDQTHRFGFCPDSACAAAASRYPAETLGMVTGCGFDSVSMSSMYETRIYHYSTDTHVLTGIQRWFDTGTGPCDAGYWEIGLVRGECAVETLELEECR